MISRNIPLETACRSEFFVTVAVIVYGCPPEMAGRPSREPGAALKPVTDLSESLLVRITSPALSRYSLSGCWPCRNRVRFGATCMSMARASMAFASSISATHSESTGNKGNRSLSGGNDWGNFTDMFARIQPVLSELDHTTLGVTIRSQNAGCSRN